VTFSNSTSNATTYSWDFGDGNTSTDENPVHDFVNNGTYTVVFTATGSCGEDTYSEDVEITGVTVLSLNEQELSIYPNPANDFVIINTQLNRYTYRMVSMDGRVLIENQVFGEGNARIDLDNISPGMYQLIINSDAQEIIHKLVKQ
jgi:PKD repeat protein